ncbi:hypothetical protein [Fructobacillus fructosus]|uniref:hypothetical protein n=1 Tax=Fructobacillus fructosus TaxID=1631 RepID=UPI00200AB2C6|nr:hypothetical protein [Fructobacillus fructosus]MCK8639109.1 hypothetical protein [Fructobacillus fructosus]
MTTPKQFKKIDDVVYNVDSDQKSNPIIRSDNKNTNTFKISGQEYQVIKTIDANDPNNREDYADNGFQGMAVAPIVDGEPDYFNVIVAYAGTNSSDPDDIITDSRHVFAGVQEDDSQFSSAEKFYQDVASLSYVRVVSTTGHSLGGALAQKVAATNHLPAVTFSTAGVGSQLTDSEKEWINGPGKSKVLNYMHRGDYVSSFTSAKNFGTAIFALDYGNGSILSGHMLNSYKFNQAGDTLTKSNVAAEKAHVATTKKIAKIKSLQAKFMSSGSLTAGQEQLLDEYEALARVEGMQTIVNSQLNDLQTKYKAAIDEAKGLWRLALMEADMIGKNLSEYEQESALAAGGVTEEIIKSKPIDEYKQSISKIKTIQKEYEELHHKIRSAIHHQVQSDTELAGEIKGMLW